MLEFLRRAFVYDLKANLVWLETLESWNDPEANQVLDHVAQAHRTWMGRVDAEELPVEQASLKDELTVLNGAWLKLLEDWDLNEHIEYRNFQGDLFSEPIWEILTHVINHATYHRGQLRGMAGSREFPDTDLIQFYRSHG